jgi:hypothetical protein
MVYLFGLRNEFISLFPNGKEAATDNWMLFVEKHHYA